MKTNLNFLKSLWSDYSVYFEERQGNNEYDIESENLKLKFIIGENYSYIIDISTQKIVYLDPNFKNIHHLDENLSKLSDLLNLIHPDDLDFMEFSEQWGFEKIISCKKNCKIGYLLRIKTIDNKYDIFYHQSYYKESELGSKLINCIHFNSNFKNITKKMLYEVNLFDIDSNELIDSTLYIPKNNSILKLLTKRELQIIKLIASGLTDKEISDKLFLSFNTVRTHRRNILRKSDVNNSIELINKCFEIDV